MAKPKPLGDTEVVFSEVVVQSFGYFPAEESWAPAMNAYETASCLELFFDLAGVDKQTIEVHAQPGRLTVRGVRTPPQPDCGEGEAMRIVSMEIDAGRFRRVLALPRRAEMGSIESRYDRGVLIVRVPLKERPSADE